MELAIFFEKTMNQNRIISQKIVGFIIGAFKAQNFF
jgi:hypothetical protein